MSQATGSQAEANRTRIDLACLVSDRIELRSVTLAKCSAGRSRAVDTRAENFKAELTLKYGYSKDAEEKTLTVFLEFHLMGGNPQVKPSQSLRVDATFVLAYSIASFENLTDANLGAFAEVNGIFQAWPFWREFVLNTTARMGVHPLTLPVHRVSHLPIGEGPSQKELPLFDE